MRVDKTKWNHVTFNDACIIIHGKDHKVVNDPNGEYPIYGSGGIMGRAHQYLCEPGTTIIGRKGTINSPIMVNERFWNIDTAFGMYPKEQVHKRFFYYYCKNFDFKKIQSGSAIPSLTRKDILKQPFVIPPFYEQQSIAAELDAVQEMIDGYKAQIADLDALAQSIFLDIFGDPITNPKGWEKKPISHFGEVVTGSTPSTKNENNYNSNDYCFVKPGDINEHTINYITESEYHISKFGFSTSRQLPIGTILVTCIGIIGKIGIVKMKCISNQQINAIVPNNNSNNVYVAYAILGIRNLLIARANGPVVPLLNKSSFSKFTIPNPPLELQQQFAIQVEAIEEQKALLRQQLADAETLMAERMQYYFS